MDTGFDEAQILSQEQRSLELLAHETHTAIATVQEVFLSEYRRLASRARINSYLPLLTVNNVRRILELAKSRHADLPAHARSARELRAVRETESR